MQTLSLRFRSKQYFAYELSGEMFYQNYKDLYGDVMLVPVLMGTKNGGRKLTETFVTEVFYKSVNISLEELINIKVILFLIHELFRYQNSPKQVTFLTYMTTLSAIM